MTWYRSEVWFVGVTSRLHSDHLPKVENCPRVGGLITVGPVRSKIQNIVRLGLWVMGNKTGGVSGLVHMGQFRRSV